MTDKFESRHHISEFQLPNKDKVTSVEKVEYKHLEEIWNSSREFNIFKTESRILIIGGTEGSASYNSYMYSNESNDPVLIDTHSHPRHTDGSPIIDCFSMQDWMSRLSNKTKDIALVYQNGAINIHFSQIPKNKNKSEERLQNIVKEFIAQNQISKKYTPNKKGLPYKDRLYYVINEMVKNNRGLEYEMSKDLLEFASKKPEVNFRRYNLQDPHSKDVEDFLKLFNND